MSMLAAAMTRIEELYAERDTARRWAQRYYAAYHALFDKYMVAQSDLDRVTAERDELAAGVQRRNKRIAELEGAISFGRATVKVMGNRIAELEEDIDYLADRVLEMKGYKTDKSLYHSLPPGVGLLGPYVPDKSTPSTHYYDMSENRTDVDTCESWQTYHEEER